MTSTPRTWVVGEVVTAAELNAEIRDQFNSFFGAWSTWTPTWQSSGTAPVLGNGTLVGRYLKVGRTVKYHINLTAGSTSTYGTGNYNHLLPAQAANAGCSYLGTAQFLGTDRWAGQFMISPNATTGSSFFSIASGNTRINFQTPTVPETFASGGVVRITGFYEAAA